MTNGSLFAFASSAAGRCAPTSAQGTLIPTRTLGAPHTILSVAPVPASTWQTLSRSAFGWRETDSTSPTTTPVKGGAAGLASSTSMPAIVRTSANAAVSMGGLQNSRNQDCGNCIFLSIRQWVDEQRRWVMAIIASVELRQKAQVTFEERAKIAHPIS